MFDLRLYITIHFHRLHNFLLVIEDFLFPPKIKIPNERELHSLLHRGVNWYNGCDRPSPKRIDVLLDKNCEICITEKRQNNF